MYISNRIKQDWNVSIKPGKATNERIYNKHVDVSAGNSSQTQAWYYEMHIQKSGHQKGPRYG